MSQITIRFPPPHATQMKFLTDTHKRIAFGGARGGGKSHAVRMKAVGLALRYQKIKIGIVRRTYPELNRNHIAPLKDILNTENPDKKKKAAIYNATEKVMKFKNGSTITFCYCDCERDVGRFQGLEFDVLFI